MESAVEGQLGRAFVDFALDGVFPEEDLSAKYVDAGHFGPILESLAAAKARLEAEINTINEQTAPDVSEWVANAKSLEDDINRSRKWANEIVRNSEAPDVSGQSIEEAENKVDFLQQEFAFNKQLGHALVGIKRVGQLLDEAEVARDERRILQSLHLLEESWTALDSIPIGRSCRAMKILDIRAFELKSTIHDVFDHVWGSLVRVDAAARQVAVFDSRADEQMSLADAVIGLKAYKEVDQRMAVFWRGLDDVLIKPRTSLESDDLSGIRVENSALISSGKADKTVSSLYDDLQIVLEYLSERLPPELISSFSEAMMPDLIPRIITDWLEPAVPSSLKNMEEFQKVLDDTRMFCDRLGSLNFSGYQDLHEWGQNVPLVWLAKCRETALESIRTQLTQGLGAAQEIERVETRLVSAEEQQNPDPTVEAPANGDGWDAAWDDGEAPANSDDKSKPTEHEDDGADAWGWGDDDDVNDDEKNNTTTNASPKHDEKVEEEDPAEAWGWGDEDTPADTHNDATVSNQNPQPSHTTQKLTLTETFYISSMPSPVLKLIQAILEDGAYLVANDANPMSAAAAGLFSLPTLVLAMFRAVSPHYYSLSDGGNMFLYNDAQHLSEEIAKLASNWKNRDDLVPRAKSMLRLDNDVQTLQSFAARAYSSEMATYRTIIRDLLGGSQTLFQQDMLGSADLEAQVENATTYIRATAATWSKILAKSAWSQAIGSLVDTVASKVVADVMDLEGIGQDDANNIANLIAQITQLDDLFLPPGADKDAIPCTAEYASNWLRLKYLSEVLQSNLQDVKFLWIESELSLYFTVEEVVDLIGLSFVDNARTREIVKEIQGRPFPRGPV